MIIVIIILRHTLVALIAPTMMLLHTMRDKMPMSTMTMRTTTMMMMMSAQ